MPEGRLACFGARRGDRVIGAAGGGAGTCVHVARVERAGFGLLNEGRRLECEMNRDEGRRSSTCARSTRPARPLFPTFAANAVSRWTPSGRTVRQIQSHQTENH